MLAPEAKPRRPRNRGLGADDIHLRVVEERVLVEIRGADREPAVVDYPDLRVDVDGLRVAGALMEGACEEALRRGRGGGRQTAKLAAGVVLSVVRLRGQEH